MKGSGKKTLIRRFGPSMKPRPQLLALHTRGAGFEHQSSPIFAQGPLLVEDSPCHDSDMPSSSSGGHTSAFVSGPSTTSGGHTSGFVSGDALFVSNGTSSLTGLHSETQGPAASQDSCATTVIGSDGEGAATSNPPVSLQQNVAEETCRVADRDPYLDLLLNDRDLGSSSTRLGGSSSSNHGDMLSAPYTLTLPQGHELPEADLVPVDLGPEVPVGLEEPPPDDSLDAMLQDGWDIQLIRCPTPQQIQQWYNATWHHLPVAMSRGRK